MTILGLWAVIAGYAVFYAGIANWQGSGMSIPDAFTGRGQIKCARAQSQEAIASTPTTGGGAGGGLSWV